MSTGQNQNCHMQPFLNLNTLTNAVWPRHSRTSLHQRYRFWIPSWLLNPSAGDLQLQHFKVSSSQHRLFHPIHLVCLSTHQARNSISRCEKRKRESKKAVLIGKRKCLKLCQHLMLTLSCKHPYRSGEGIQTPRASVSSSIRQRMAVLFYRVWRLEERYIMVI
nr:hypothetical protein Iba_chr14aCG0800 [Ipomoea batatas]